MTVNLSDRSWNGLPRSRIADDKLYDFGVKIGFVTSAAAFSSRALRTPIKKEQYSEIEGNRPASSFGKAMRQETGDQL